MSRMRRLNKEKIKATISGLALMITIGTAGGIGSYAYFTDQAEAKNDLVVTMGNLDVSITDITLDVNGNTVYEDRLEYKQYSTATDDKPIYEDIVILSKEFKIMNEGSLKQDLDIIFSHKISKDGNIIDTNKLGLAYMLEIRDKNKNIIKEQYNLDSITIDNLASGDKLYCSVRVVVPEIMNEEDRKNIQGGEIELDINVDAKQIDIAKEGTKNENKQ